MKIHHIRNATMIIEVKNKFILVDPMLGPVGTAGPPFTFIRFSPKRNPTVGLPSHVWSIINKTNHCLITHQHPDHLDKAGLSFLKDRNIPVTCSKLDSKALRKQGLNIVQTLDYWEPTAFLDGTIHGIPATHGYGFVSKLMGNVMGYFISFPNEKTLYLSSDTILTSDVERVLNEYKPDINVLACGAAQLDILKPLLMKMEDIVRFIKMSSGQVIANHLQALNHCPTTRKELKKRLTIEALTDRVLIPDDGDSMIF